MTLVACLITCFLMVLCCLRIRHYTFQPLFGIFVYIFFGLLGFTLASGSRPKPATPEQWQVLGGFVKETPRTKGAIVRFPVDCRGAGIPETLRITPEHSELLLRKESLQPIREKIQVYLPEDSLSLKIRYGDFLLFHARPEILKDPETSFAFNFRKYSARRGICRQVYLQENRYVRIPGEEFPNKLTGFRNKTESLRERAGIYWKNLFLRAGLRGNDLAVALAMTLGSGDAPEKELREAYAASGVSHLLSISGLHTGIVSAVLMALLQWMRYLPGGRLIREILVIAGIWTYAWLTGFSAPVCRSAWMFSLFLAGKAVSPETDSFHTLCVSAFILLYSHPMLLFDTSFQLSYAAMTGILLFFKPLRNVWKVKNRVLARTRDLCLVSIAAQAVSLPFCLVYFHQFPRYFLLTNLLVIPLAGCIVWGAAVLWASAPFPWLFASIASVFRHVTHLLNLIIYTVESLPGAVARDIPFVATEGFFYLAALYFLFRGVYEKNTVFIRACLVCILAWKLYAIHLNRNAESQEAFFIHKTQKELAAQWIRGRYQTLFISSPEKEINSREKIREIQWSLRVRNTDTVWIKNGRMPLKYGFPDDSTHWPSLKRIRKGGFYNPRSRISGPGEICHPLSISL